MNRINHTNKTAQKIAYLLILLLALVTGLSLLWILMDHSHLPTSHTMIADIYCNGELLQSIPLNTVTESYTFTITGENQCRNEIEVRPGSIGIISADCPDKLCVKQGFIDSSLLPITCLPNKLVIQIRTDETTVQDSSIDMITY
uniref:NusG domain II-containing protein n=1 Tax=Acetatifactor sp. TaxID=1872090 RepID=UPI004057B649